MSSDVSRDRDLYTVKKDRSDEPLPIVKAPSGSEISFSDTIEDNAREEAKDHLKKQLRGTKFAIDESEDESEDEEEEEMDTVCEAHRM